ncbi:hypothetical protein [Algibacter lectus]|uniref:hypothetical protein n=1 Tax=Algibacter lectus TaxID=221126 RepID=UPI0026ECBA1E|nr:hypothetical protein [Algibacter lectus]
MFLGSSHLYFGINPNVIWKNNKLLTYNLGMNEQPMWLTYFYLIEALKYQKPKVLVLETFYLENTREYKNNNGFSKENINRISLDPLKFSLNKINAIKESVPENQFTDYILNINKYHDRWKKLYKNDFMRNDEPYFYKGFTSSLKVYKETRIRDLKHKTGRRGMELHNKSLDYTDKIIQLAKENNIEVVFIKTPLAQAIFRQEFTDALVSIKEYADDNKIDFIDYNKIYDEIGFDFLKHMSDASGHLNKYGAEIISKHIGNYLKSKYFKDKKNEDLIVNEWDKTFLLYKEKEGKRIAKEKIKYARTLKEYLNYAKSLDLLVLTAVRDDGSGQYRNYKKSFKSIGLESNLNKKFRWSYVGVKNMKTGFAKEIIDTTKVSINFKSEKLDIKLTSIGGNKPGNMSSILINGKEYSKNLRGHNFVIIDLKEQKVLDAFNIDTHGDDKLLIKK